MNGLLALRMFIKVKYLLLADSFERCPIIALFKTTYMCLQFSIYETKYVGIISPEVLERFRLLHLIIDVSILQKPLPDRLRYMVSMLKNFDTLYYNINFRINR